MLDEIVRAGLDDERCVGAILKACAEERKSALIEAATLCRDQPMPDTKAQFDFGCLACAKAIDARVQGVAVEPQAQSAAAPADSPDASNTELERMRAELRWQRELSTENVRAHAAAEIEATTLRQRVSELEGALNDCLSLMARHSWLARDKPKIAAAERALSGKQTQGQTQGSDA